MIKTMKKTLFGFLAMTFLFSPVAQKAAPPMLQASIAVQATTKKQALKAYKKHLSKKKIPFYTRVGKTVKLDPKKTSFDIAYINKGKYPYLLVYADDNKGIDHSTRYVNLLGAKGNKIKFICNYDTVSYIKNKGVIGLPVPRSEDMEYYKISGNKVKNMVSRPAGKEIWNNKHKVTKKNIKKYIK